jgi:hypothetical protein
VEAANTLAALPHETGENQYRAACVLAFNLPRSGQDPMAAGRIPTDQADKLADRAMSLLSQALTRGYTTSEGLEGDVALDALRARPDFPALFKVLLDRGFPADPFAH